MEAVRDVGCAFWPALPQLSLALSALEHRPQPLLSCPLCLEHFASVSRLQTLPELACAPSFTTVCAHQLIAQKP